MARWAYWNPNIKRVITIWTSWTKYTAQYSKPQSPQEQSSNKRHSTISLVSLGLVISSAIISVGHIIPVPDFLNI
jgi:hypothetical protein